jgi:hypothetical protein
MRRNILKTLKNILYFSLVLVLLITLTGFQSFALEEKPDVLITSIGQSADARMVSVLLTRHDIETAYEQLASTEIIKDYKIVIAVVGGSSKGLGAAGIDQRDEIARTKELLQEIEEQEVILLVMHTGGEARRGALSDAFLDEIVPYANHLIVVESGNMDGYFTDISKEKDISIEIVAKIVDTGELVKSFIAENLEQ